ncbi:DUF3289 family protein [Pedobacter sp. KLB.chiD]|uniref:DUF3289 family protein n=1 Tax=Pedobacter sp. KLB.chiD TaxID=3387402 RepID=UPI003999F177
MNTQKTKGTIQRVGPPETVDCFTVVKFEFYYQFTGYPGSNPTAWNYQVTTTFINQFYSYLNFDSQYYSTNPDGSLTFYNMPDGENHINSIIYNALYYAKNFCTASFNLTESDLITYFFYAQYSTCNTGPGDGGGSLANGLVVEDAPEEPEIINNIDINFVDDNFGTPLRIIGYTQDRGNTEDLEYGTNGDVSWAPPYLQNLLDDQYFFSMTDLFEKCTTFDSGLKSVGLDMIDKFRNGTGADYGNIILNQRATGSVQTLNFLKEFGATFNQQLLQANMNLNNVAPINMGGNRPKYDGLYNKFHGLQILVNDTEQSKIFLESFTPLPNNKWKAVVQLEIVDHFGLDLHDAQTYQDWHDGFPSWWILQHERNYRPFKTKIWVRLEMSVK